MTTGKRILIVDDDQDIHDIYRACFRDTDFAIDSAMNGQEGLKKVRSFAPELIILDIMMPGMNGYEFCSGLLAQEGEISIPILFASAEQDNDKANAFSYGVVDYLVKPFRKSDLFESISRNIVIGDRWKVFLENTARAGENAGGSGIKEFAEFLASKTGLDAASKERLLNASPKELYSAAWQMKITPEATARALAEFYKMKYIPLVDPSSVTLGFLPVSFLQKNKAVPVTDSTGESYIAISEPFNGAITKLIKEYAGRPLCVTEPDNVNLLFNRNRLDSGVGSGNFSVEGAAVSNENSNKWESSAMMKIANTLLAKTILNGEYTVKIEPRNPVADIRLGAQKPFQVMAKTALAVVMRYKILAGIDVVENQRAQAGDFRLGLDGKKYRVQLVTSPTSSGENCSINIKAV